MPRLSEERMEEIRGVGGRTAATDFLVLILDLRDAITDLLVELDALRTEHAALVKLLEAVEEANRGKTFYEGQELRPIDAAAKKAREVLNADQS